MTYTQESKLSLYEIRDMYYNVFKKRPQGKYANNKLKLLEKINNVESINREGDTPSKKIKLGTTVKWTKNGKELTGVVEKITKKNYKICCKPGKQSGDKESVYVVNKGMVELHSGSDTSKQKHKSINKEDIQSEESIINTLESLDEDFKFMDDIDIDINLTNDTPAYKTDEIDGLKTRLCKKYKDIEYINLNKIEVSDIENSKCNEIKKKKYFDGSRSFKLIYNKKIDLCNIKYISEGSFGTVYMYSDKDEKYKIAVKNYYDNTDDEINIYKLLLDRGVDCNIINMKIIEYRPYFSKYYVGVMDYMHGSLSDLKGSVDKELFLPMIKEIALSLDCLKKKKLSYTDLKLDNVLYKCNGDKIKIVLGDIGSICREGDHNSCTWLPIEYLKTGGFPKCNESTMVWGLGVIILELLNFNVKYFHYSNIEKFQTADIKKSSVYIYHKYYIPIKNNYKEYFKFKPNTLKIEDIIFGIFSKTKGRIKLKDIIDAIK